MYSNFFPVSISLCSSELIGGSNILYNKTKNIGQASLASHLNTQQLHKRSCNISEKTIGLSNALWSWIMKVNFRLRRNLVLHGLLNKNHSGMHSYFQRFRC